MPSAFWRRKRADQNIILKSKAVAVEVCNEVAKALKRNAEIDASHIVVSGDKNTIYLKARHTWPTNASLYCSMALTGSRPFKMNWRDTIVFNFLKAVQLGKNNPVPKLHFRQLDRS